MLTDKIFDGNYGSLLENHLEPQMEQLSSKKSKILEVNCRWRQAQIMMEYGCKQLSIALQKWGNLPSIPAGQLQHRYSVAQEVRNNLNASSQNAFDAHRYLKGVQFPYITEREIAILDKAANYVFTDMQSKPRHDHALECFNTNYMRMNKLIQWFDMIQEMYGTNVELNETLRGRDITALDLVKANISHQHAIKMKESDNESRNHPPSHLMSKESLAPAPPNSIIFGRQYENFNEQIQNLQANHREEMVVFLKDQEHNETRMKSKLEDKLIARRQRRARIKLEEKQIQALSN